jgi:hypothetical protein
MTKVYKQLTADQKARGVVFSSTLSANRRDDELGQRTHEVLDTDKNKDKTIGRLLEDSFFNGSPWKYNVIRK